MSFTTTEKVRIAPSFEFDADNIVVSLSQAEAQVIRNKAKKAGISVNEYVRNAALGFPMG